MLAQEQTLRFRLSRFNRYSDFYDIGDGEWGWFDENIDEDREQLDRCGRRRGGSENKRRCGESVGFQTAEATPLDSNTPPVGKLRRATWLLKLNKQKQQ